MSEMYPHRRLLANVAPSNDVSLQFFQRLGAQLIQMTFELPEEEEATP